MPSVTVRIGDDTREILRLLVARTGRPAGEVIREAIEEYRRKCFLEDANRAFAALKANPRAWRREKAERKAWDDA